jgi:orotate phosphoribosyltransferase
VIIGYELARQLNLPSIFCERVDGKFEFRRGFEVPKGANILIVEDVVTTAKSSLETVECIKTAGGNPVAEASLVDRSGGEATKILPFPLVSLLKINVPIYDPANLPSHLANIEAIKPGSRFLKS